MLLENLKETRSYFCFLFEWWDTCIAKLHFCLMLEHISRHVFKSPMFLGYIFFFKLSKSLVECATTNLGRVIWNWGTIIWKWGMLCVFFFRNQVLIKDYPISNKKKNNRSPIWNNCSPISNNSSPITNKLAPISNNCNPISNNFLLISIKFQR